jgi:hypothetical protein
MKAKGVFHSAADVEAGVQVLMSMFASYALLQRRQLLKLLEAHSSPYSICAVVTQMLYGFMLQALAAVAAGTQLGPVLKPRTPSPAYVLAVVALTAKAQQLVWRTEMTSAIG